MHQASMFLSQMSVVDHAWIDKSGQVRGGSFNPSFLVHGPVDPVEKVVVDFSTVKRTLKGLLDHDKTGFDHKLWLIEGFSGARHEISRDPEPRIRITGRSVLDLPLDAVKLVKNPQGLEYDIRSAGIWMEEDINARIGALHPGVRVECRNSTAKHVFDPSVFGGEAVTQSVIEDFRYVHGLRDSTSWGCQNIAHGHLSFVQLVPASPGPAALDRLRPLARKIAGDLQDAVFVRDDNVVGDTPGQLDIGYACSRGRFGFAIDRGQRIIRLKTETTIEYLVEHVREKWGPELKEAGCRWLFLSEGLTKGASVDLAAGA